MKKIGYWIYLICALGGCLSLLVTMFFKNSTMENEAEAGVPQIIQKGQLNTNISNDTENYLANHLGGRQLLLDTYATFLSKQFSTSAVRNVIIGEDGYLYFAETLKDYQGIATLSDRELYNIRRTLELVQEYVEAKDGRFLFLVAPNKNSVIKNMPHRYLQVSKENNWNLLKKQLNQESYADVFPIFRNETEELYYKTDSHWNNEGARRVYHQILTVLGKDHDDFLSYKKSADQKMTGDLYKMLYTANDRNERVIQFEKKQSFEYLTRTRSTEQPYIETYNEEATGSLLMYRDSFANNLISFLSDAYQMAVYDKEVPYNLTRLDTYAADAVIVEIAERNLTLIQKNLPVFLAPQRETLAGKEISDLIEKVEIKKEEYDMVWGTLNENYCSMDSQIYLKVGTTFYEMTPQTMENNAYGFGGYLQEVEDNTEIVLFVTGKSGYYCQRIQ